MKKKTSLSLCLFVLFKVSLQERCLRGPTHHECDNRSDNFDLDFCLQQQWACDPDEFCYMNIDNHGLDHFDCQPVHTLDHCQENQQQHNSFLCRYDTHIHTAHMHRECYFCCTDKQCILDTFRKTTTSHPSTTPLPTSPPSTSSQPTTSPALQPAHNSCYTSLCNHGDDLDTCSSGQWACRQDQFCDVHINQTSEGISMMCRDDTFDELLQCQQLLLQHHCYPLGDSYDHDCHYCCTDAACLEEINNSRHKSTSQPLMTSSTSSSSSSSASLQPHGPSAACTVCEDLGCLLQPPTQVCQAGQMFCLTTVRDSPQGRYIKRGCADKMTCDDLHLQQTLQNDNCKDVAQQILHTDNTCHFCCHGDNCNHAPQILPDDTTLYRGDAPGGLVGRAAE